MAAAGDGDPRRRRLAAGLTGAGRTVEAAIARQQRSRGITGDLYGGTPELRLQQELVRGIGGWLLLEALGL